MSLVSTAVLAFSMSTDAFAVAVGKGVNMPTPSLRKAMAIGLLFAIVETITPVLGWLIGQAANDMIAHYDHWIAFIILSLVGSKMLYEGAFNHKDKPKQGNKIGLLVLTAIGTSIDAMAVGMTLALMDMSIWIPALAIGSATFLMTTIGILMGHYIGIKGGRIAEALGGIGLILIGTKILLEHLGVLSTMIP